MSGGERLGLGGVRGRRGAGRGDEPGRPRGGDDQEIGGRGGRGEGALGDGGVERRLGGRQSQREHGPRARVVDPASGGGGGPAGVARDPRDGLAPAPAGVGVSAGARAGASAGRAQLALQRAADGLVGAAVLVGERPRRAGAGPAETALERGRGAGQPPALARAQTRGNGDARGARASEGFGGLGGVAEGDLAGRGADAPGDEALAPAAGEGLLTDAPAPRELGGGHGAREVLGADPRGVGDALDEGGEVGEEGVARDGGGVVLVGGVAGEGADEVALVHDVVRARGRGEGLGAAEDLDDAGPRGEAQLRGEPLERGDAERGQAGHGSASVREAQRRGRRPGASARAPAATASSRKRSIARRCSGPTS